jgi:hypothetical protein
MRHRLYGELLAFFDELNAPEWEEWGRDDCECSSDEDAEANSAPCA